MYSYLLFFHSVFRWLVLVSLLYAIYRAFRGTTGTKIYTKAEDSIRHWTATIAHIQLVIGFVLYVISPLVKFFLSPQGSVKAKEPFFFSVLHIGLMLIAIIVITTGSSLAKRKLTDAEKFRTQLTWFSIGLLLILLAIPWPFSPLAARPYFRPL